jgi:hypothetical protein
MSAGMPLLFFRIPQIGYRHKGHNRHPITRKIVQFICQHPTLFQGLLQLTDFIQVVCFLLFELVQNKVFAGLI